MTNAVAAVAVHARQRPDGDAVVDPYGGVLTYGELHARAGALAAGLRRAGVSAGDRVGVHGDKVVDSVVAILGTLYAGAAYVPLDPSAPASRRARLVTDAGCRLVLTPAARLPQVTADLAPVPVRAVADLVEAGSGPPAGGGPVAPVDGNAVAYVMYTSGSTGAPKGVQIPHRALSAFFSHMDAVMAVTPESVCLNTSALHFDVSVVDLLYPLTRGAPVHLGPPMPLPAALLGTLQTKRITHVAAVGSTLTLLTQSGRGLAGRDLTALRRIMTGAEVLNPATVQQWLAAAPQATVINGYGPTEATCVVIAHPIAEREPGRTRAYPIGRPLPGTRVRFRTADGRITDDGPGELLIGGDQLMLGYLNRPEEDAAAFLDIGGERYYRTGDFGERAAEGVIEFHGRRDDEVKVRGYRINLNEVRRAVETHPRVARAFVAAVPDPRDGLALACAVLPDDAREQVGEVTGDADLLVDLPVELDDELPGHLAAQLPAYMVPREFHGLRQFPILPTGKPDTRLLRGQLVAAAGADGTVAAGAG